MKTETQKWGNSLAIRIPSAFAREIGLGDGVAVDLRLTSGKLVISVVKKRRDSLGSLLAQMRKSNQHDETDWGGPVGGEVW